MDADRVREVKDALHLLAALGHLHLAGLRRLTEDEYRLLEDVHDFMRQGKVA